uniref:Uncharacterized protein n=1 Tax=Anguilla anguilla TaxID=7936 RepID=A0A0E9T1R3_ANGAN
MNCVVDVQIHSDLQATLQSYMEGYYHELVIIHERHCFAVA